MKKRLRCLLRFHKYKLVYETLGWEYLQCELCGHRKAWKVYHGTFSAPGTQRWVDGEFETMEQALEVTRGEFEKAIRDGRTVKVTGTEFANHMRETFKI